MVLADGPGQDGWQIRRPVHQQRRNCGRETVGAQALADSAAQLFQGPFLCSARCLFREYLCPSVEKTCGSDLRDYGILAGCLRYPHQDVFQFADEDFRKKRRTRVKPLPPPRCDGLSLRPAGKKLSARELVWK